MTTTGVPRGTSARGQQRRQALLEAAAELIIEDGFSAVSHRGIAQRAELPLAATTYYFASLDDLLEQALRHLAASWLDQARSRLAQLPAHLNGQRRLAEAVLLVAIATPDGDERDAGQDGLALYERYLEAGRRPHLRTVVAAYNHEVDLILREVLRRGGLPHDMRTARLLLAQVDGAMLRALAEGVDPVPVALAAVTDLVRLLSR